MTSWGSVPSTSASRVSTDRPLSFMVSSSVRLAETTRWVALSASGTPRESRIEPRTAGWTTCWTWLFFASSVYSEPLRIWRYHRRPPSVSSSEKTTIWMTTSRFWTRGVRPVSGMLLNSFSPGRLPTPGRV